MCTRALFFSNFQEVRPKPVLFAANCSRARRNKIKAQGVVRPPLVLTRASLRGNGVAASLPAHRNKGRRLYFYVDAWGSACLSLRSWTKQDVCSCQFLPESRANRQFRRVPFLSGLPTLYWRECHDR